MAILQILHFPDPRLRKISTPVIDIDDRVRTLVDDMFATMYYAPGVGLAAPQVNVHERIIVIDASELKNKPICLINPEIILQEGIDIQEEGCLSLPNLYEKVPRAHRVVVKALSKEGKKFELDAEDLLSVCIQHEIDHLDGKIFVDYLSRFKRDRITKKMEKMRLRTL
ncbi:MAG: peptide deformylase [Gammaproteobacteria bacterium]|nr:peptide deformylase [Gammaproteobacteria bacterium]